MGKKITITIEGYGQVQVARPKKLTKKSFADGLADAVVQTCELMMPRKGNSSFHPVLGFRSNN